MKKYFMSYGTSHTYHGNLRDISAKSFLHFNNFDSYFLLDEKSIKEDYYQKHINIFSQKRGAGYWLWKPYLIDRILSTMEENDILMYCDSCISQINDLSEVLTVALDRHIITFIVNDGMSDEREVCKRDALILTDSDNANMWSEPIPGQLGASYIFFRKTPRTVNIVKKWLTFCEDERILTDKENVMGKPNYPMFVDHRHDQSVLSLLCKQNDFLPIYDITQYGNDYRKESWGQLLYHGR